MKKLLSVVLTAALICIVVMPCVLAAQSQGINILFAVGDKLIEGEPFSLYYIGDVSGSKIIPKGDFVKYPVSYDVSDSGKMQTLATTLAIYAASDNLKAVAEDITDSDGRAYFGNRLFGSGAYLLLSDDNKCEPAIIIIPVGDDETLTVKPKADDSTDEEYISIKVLKAWKNDTEAERPTEIEVELLKDGEVFDTVILNKSNNWKYVRDNLLSDFDWTVKEKEVPDGYKVSVSKNGNVYLITNTLYDTEESTTKPSDSDTTRPSGSGTTVPSVTEPTLPQTGMLMWPVPYFALAGLLLFMIGFAVKRKSEADYE